MVDESLGDAAEVFEQTPNQSLRSTTLQMLRCVSSPPGSTLSKNNHTNKDVAEPPASALPECSARPGPAGHAPAWFPTNVARNSPNRLSNFEIRSLQFQGFQGTSKTDRGKLRATF